MFIFVYAELGFRHRRLHAISLQKIKNSNSYTFWEKDEVFRGCKFQHYKDISKDEIRREKKDYQLILLCPSTRMYIAQAV